MIWIWVLWKLGFVKYNPFTLLCKCVKSHYLCFGNEFMFMKIVQEFLNPVFIAYTCMLPIPCPCTWSTACVVVFVSAHLPVPCPWTAPVVVSSVPGEYNESFSMLKHLSSVPRFGTVSMFMSSSDKSGRWLFLGWFV